MGLADWAIRVSLEACDDENMAEIDCAYAQRNATMYLSDKWDTYPAEEQRATLTHELVHALLAPYTQHIDVLVKALVDRQELSRTAEASLLHMEEIVVDQIAVAWAEKLPLPGEVS
jgi:Zn-dependent peptidase ImmA (M78 family)